MPPSNLSDYLAAERTILAWIRTGPALAGFGSVIARVGRFLRRMRLNEGASGPGPVGSPGFGAALILARSLVLPWSMWSYARPIRRLARSDSSLRSPTTTAPIYRNISVVDALAAKAAEELP
jgi:putative membrane protein